MEKKKISRNIITVLCGDILVYSISFIYFMYSARYFGVQDFGVLSLSIALTSILSIFINFGTEYFTIREVARNEILISKIINNSILIKSVFGVIGFVFLNMYLKTFNYSYEVFLVSNVMYISIVIGAINLIFDSVFQGMQKTIYHTLSKNINAIFLIISLLIAMRLELKLIYFIYAYPLINFIILVYFVIDAKQNNMKFTFDIDTNYLKYMMKESWPFAINFAFVIIYSRTDTAMLSVFKDQIEVGYYNVASNMTQALLFIPTAFNIAIYPVISKYFIEKDSKTTIAYTIQKYFKAMLIIGMPIGIGVTLLSEKIILEFFGKEYLPSESVLKILIWFTVLTFLHAPFSRLFASINRQTITTKITGVSALINVMLNYLLIPKYSIVGASIATLITEAIIFTSLIIIATHYGYFRVKSELKDVFKIILCGIAMTYTLLVIKEWNIIYSMTISGALYILLILILNVIDKKDIMSVKSICTGSE